MKKIYISPITEQIKMEGQPLMNEHSGVPNSDQDDDGGRAKGNKFGNTSYWDDKIQKSLWED